MDVVAVCCWSMSVELARFFFTRGKRKCGAGAAWPRRSAATAPGPTSIPRRGRLPLAALTCCCYYAPLCTHGVRAPRKGHEPPTRTNTGLDHKTSASPPAACEEKNKYMPQTRNKEPVLRSGILQGCVVDSYRNCVDKQKSSK